MSNHFHLTTSVSVFPSIGVQSLPSHNIRVGLPISWCPITSISQHQCRSSHLLVSNHFACAKWRIAKFAASPELYVPARSLLSADQNLLTVYGTISNVMGVVPSRWLAHPCGMPCQVILGTLFLYLLSGPD